MELRTRIDIERSNFRITYSDPVFLIGSCFASEIGLKLSEGKLPVMINPSGTVYNPLSVDNTLNLVISGKMITRNDLYCHEGTWLSFSHYTNFSSSDPDVVVNNVNLSTMRAHEFLKNAHYLFITFGTARVFRLKETGAVVSNCHKIPSSSFENQLLNTEDIVQVWNTRLSLLRSHFPELKVIFTISPVRHWKDGAHGNQVSKSVLFLAVEQLLFHPSAPQYFPAYELLLDDLRDYRFYADDLLHPSAMAVEYIWEAFSGSYFDESTMELWKEVSGITRAVKHRLSSSDPEKVKIFADRMLTRILRVVKGPDLSEEAAYFRNLAKQL